MKWALMVIMRSIVFLALVAVAATCGPDPNAKLPGSAHSAGGQGNEGGTTDSGGTATDHGGTVGTGGVVGSSGKVVGSGGKVGTGGRVGSGGAAGGGRDAGPWARDSGAAGAENGGAIGSGGRIGSGGMFGRNDAAIVTRDSSLTGPEVAGGCISAVVANNYVCGSASCADCKDNNGNSREDGCQKAIDCIAEKGAACDTNCENNCRNLAGDTYGQACVTALKTAACGAGGCGATVGPRG